MQLVRVVLCSCVAFALGSLVTMGQGKADRAFVPDEDNVPPTTDVRIFKAKDIQAAIAGDKTGRLLEGKELFSLNLLHRTGEEVTIHGSVVDTYFIQKGSATLEHGGTAVNAKLSGGRAGDQRAESMKGSAKTRVETGDIVFIPPGVPHRFLKGESDIVYFNVHYPGK